MRIKGYIIFYIVLIVFFSCVKEKGKVIEDTLSSQQETEKIEIMEMATIIVEQKVFVHSVVPATEEEKESMKEYLKNDLLSIGNEKINFIERVNFGIPGGDNWIIRLEPNYNGNSWMIIYVIDGDNIIKRFYETFDGLAFYYGTEKICEYDIMQDIPGMHIPDGNISIGDFNDDGIFELLVFFYNYYVGYNIDIFYYDSENDVFVVNRINFGLIDPINGPAPIEFSKYNGINGLKVHYDFRWKFYAWNTVEKEYTEVVEISNELNIGYDIHNFQLSYFWNRIENVMETNMSSLENVVEIEPKFEGGRSFMATSRAYDNTYRENRHDFYHNGEWAGWYIDE
jgi:hypothetical protein